MSVQYNLVDNGTNPNISVFADGEVYAADSTHPNWEAIVAGAIARDPEVVHLFDRGAEMAERFEQITERVSVADGRVFFDGDEINNAVTKGLVRAMNEGSDFIKVARFLENLASNPSEHSKENLYRWLDAHEFTITSDGCLVGYKGVNRNAEGAFVSVNSGSAIVNGDTVRGQIPNAVGSVVQMPRHSVAHDPDVACHVGLHVGTWSYADAFGRGGTLKVKVNPRDVVSVPNDHSNEKMRVCRYEVIAVEEKPVEEFVDYDDAYDDDDFGDLEDWETELLGLNVPEVTKVEEAKKRSFWPFR